jgi:hypothetical protein
VTSMGMVQALDHYGGSKSLGDETRVGIATGWAVRVRFAAVQDFSIASRPTPGLTQPPIQWVPGALSPGVKRRGVKLTTHTHLHPVPRSQKGGTIPPLPHMSSWNSVLN